MKTIIQLYRTKVAQYVLIFFALLGAIITISEVSDIIKKITEPNKEEKAIQLLGVHKNFDVFQEELGKSDYKELLKFSNEDAIDEIINIYHYNLENTYISLFTDEDNIVIAYTLVLKNANKRLPVPTIMEVSNKNSPYLSATTTLSEFQPTPKMVSVNNSVRDLHYAEIAGTGSYANYNYYLLGFSQVGFIHNIDPIVEFYFEVSNEKTDYSSDFINHPDLSEYRSKIVPNGYGEIYRDASNRFLEIMVERPIGPYKYDLPIVLTKENFNDY